MQSKHFLAGLLFVIVAGFVALFTSIFLIMLSPLGNNHSVQGHGHNGILLLKSKNLNDDRFLFDSKIEINQSAATRNVSHINDKQKNNNFYLPKKCGLQMSRSGSVKIGHPIYARIIGGREANPNNFPWMVSLRDFKNQNLYDHFCGGVLISLTHVLTAAHCLIKRKSNEVIVVTGIHIRTDTSNYAIKNSYNVSKIIIHENYTQNRSENDIALLILTSPVKISSNVSFICLPDEKKSKIETDYYIGKKAVSVGWGVTENSESSLLLQQTSMDILRNTDDKCKLFLSNYSTISMYCTMGTNSNMCIGDSGGPLFINDNNKKWTLLGIVSYVSAYFSTEKNKYICGQNAPSFYSSVPFYLKWINSYL